jgi:hypothetical protein
MSGLPGGFQHFHNCFIGSNSHLLRDCHSVHIGTDRVESDTRLSIPQFGFEKGGDESGRHLRERVRLLFPTYLLECFGDSIEVSAQGGLEK